MQTSWRVEHRAANGRGTRSAGRSIPRASPIAGPRRGGPVRARMKRHMTLRHLHPWVLALALRAHDRVEHRGAVDCLGAAGAAGAPAPRQSDPRPLLEVAVPTAIANQGMT